MVTGANDMSLTRTVGSMPRVFLDVTFDHWRLRYMPHDWYPFLLETHRTGG
jgi:hypothetical protein